MESAINFAQELGRWLQVDLGGTDIDVTHVRGQRREPGVDILAVPIPCQEPVDCERVTQVMDTGSLAIVVHDAALPQESSERIVDRCMTQAMTLKWNRQRRIHL